MTFASVLVLLAVFAALIRCSNAAAATSQSFKDDGNTCLVLHMSDFHLDPFYGTPNGFACTNASDSLWGTNGCDAPYQLIRNAVRQASAVLQAAPSPCAVALFTGDWVRHDAPSMPNADAAMISIWQNLTSLFAEAFEGAPHVHLAAHTSFQSLDVGNEDFIPDYHLDVNNTNTSLLRNYSSVLLRGGLLSDEAASQFAYCGFYSHSWSTGNFSVKILALNTVIYTFLLTPRTSVADPCGQFAFLQRELVQARSQGIRVWITAHVPPVSQLWSLPYFDTFSAIVNEYRDVIAASFYGHTHATSFASWNDTSTEIAPMFISGAITRVSDTNPTFQLYNVDRSTASVVGWTQWYLNESFTWQSHDVAAVLKASDLTGPSLFSAGVKLRENTSYFSEFYKVFEGGFVADGTNCSTLCQRIVSCSTYALTLVELGICIL